MDSALDQEILADFRKESEGLMGELETVVEALEDSGSEFPVEPLKEFSQKIDRIMGTAKTMLTIDPSHQGISVIAKVSEMCKTMGYQAAALQRVNLIPIFAGFWAETVEVMNAILAQIESAEKTKAVIDARVPVLQKRLAWLAEKVAPNSPAEQEKVVALLKNL